MSSTIVSARSLFFQKELHEDLIEVKSIFLFASLRTETSGLLRLRLLIPNGGYCFTMVVTALRWWLLLYVCAYSFSIRSSYLPFLYIFHFGKRETFGSEISPGPWYKKEISTKMQETDFSLNLFISSYLASLWALYLVWQLILRMHPCNALGFRTVAGKCH